MGRQAFLALQDGSWYEGEAFGSEAFAYGEVVFNTGMTGYQEMLTDPLLRRPDSDTHLPPLLGTTA